MFVFEIGFQFETSTKRTTFKAQKIGVKDHVFNQKSFISGMLKSLSSTSRIQNLDNENKFTVLCTSERGQMAKLDKVPTN